MKNLQDPSRISRNEAIKIFTAGTNTEICDALLAIVFHDENWRWSQEQCLYYLLEIALASGFDDQSAFTRCFKETFGYPPKEARKKLNIVNELDCVELSEPELIELTDIPLQSVTETGLYFESAPRAWKNLKEKLSEHELSDDFSGLFIGIGHDNPHDGTVEEDQVRYSACVAHAKRHLAIENRVISGGKYARFYYTGKPVNLGLAYHYIYGKWLENSDNKINPKIPAFVAYDSFPDGLTEHRLMINVPLISLD